MADLTLETPCPVRSSAPSSQIADRLKSIHQNSGARGSTRQPSTSSLARRRLATNLHNSVNSGITTGSNQIQPVKQPAARRKPLYIAPTCASNDTLPPLKVAPPRPTAARRPNLSRSRQASYHATDRLSHLQQVKKTAQSPLTSRSPNMPSPRRDQDSYTKAFEYLAQDLTEQTVALPRPPRRRTIFVPSDNTTIMSIHPGATSPTSSRAEDIRSRVRRTGLIEVHPDPDVTNKRFPDQTGRSIDNPVNLEMDHPQPQRVFGDTLSSNNNSSPLPPKLGADLNFENVPPGWIVEQFAIGASKRTGCGTRKSFDLASDASKDHDESAATPNKAPTPSVANSSAHLKRLLSISSPTDDTPIKHQRRNSRLLSFNLRSSPVPALDTISQRTSGNGSIGSPRVSSARSSTSGSGTININAWSDASPSTRIKEIGFHLYDQHWKGHQETAIVQMLNILLDLPNTGHNLSFSIDASKFQAHAIAVWEKYQMHLTVKRLEGALKWGGLALPNAQISVADRLEKSPHHRNVLLRLLINSYPMHFLQAALMFIVKKPMPEPMMRVPESATESFRNDVQKGLIEGYIADYLIGNKDDRSSNIFDESITRTPEDQVKTHKWERTVQRTLMLILVLDKMKLEGCVRGNLFRKQSTCQSSACVLRAFGELLVPFSKRLAITVGLLGYKVDYIQPLTDCFDYQIRNLATDMRDGVRLHRLLTKLGLGDVANPTENKLAVDRLSIHEQAADKPFNMSPLTRLQKINNVRLIIDAFAGATKDKPCTINAQDIVDGYRERTLEFLWKLITHPNATAKLFSPRFLRSEINKHSIATVSPTTDSLERSTDVSYLLRRWAQGIFSISNYNEDLRGEAIFSNETLYINLINHYAPHITQPAKLGLKHNLATADTIAQKLRLLGSSPGFTAAFTCPMHADAVTHHLSQVTEPWHPDFVTAALIFLAHKLLLPLQKVKVATKLQRAFRAKQEQMQVLAEEEQRQLLSGKKRMLRHLAVECAQIVKCSEKVTGAVIKIQRFWRRAVERQCRRLMEDVTKVQAVAKGAILRKMLRVDGPLK